MLLSGSATNGKITAPLSKIVKFLGKDDLNLFRNLVPSDLPRSLQVLFVTLVSHAIPDGRTQPNVPARLKTHLSPSHHKVPDLLA